MPTSRISACMVLHHSAKAMDTVNCLASSSEKVDLFVVDNSPDEQTVEEIQRVFPTARIIQNERNVGYGRANNQVIRELRSRYHLILNPDVTFDPQLIGRMVRYMDSHPDIAILTPRVMNPDGTEQAVPRLRPRLKYLAASLMESYSRHCKTLRKQYTMTDQPITEPMEVPCATGCFLLIRTHLFYRIGGFDKRYFLYMEDCDLSLRAARVGKVVYDPQFEITHAWGREDRKDPILALRHFHSAIRFMMKWGW